jgi:hypothetical protein
MLVVQAEGVRRFVEFAKISYGKILTAGAPNLTPAVYDFKQEPGHAFR